MADVIVSVSICHPFYGMIFLPHSRRLCVKFPLLRRILFAWLDFYIGEMHCCMPPCKFPGHVLEDFFVLNRAGHELTDMAW